MKIEIRSIYVGINSIDFNFLTFGLTRNIGSYEIEEQKDLQNLIDLASGIFYQNFEDYKIIHFFNSGFYLDKKNYIDNPVGLRSKTLDVNFSFLSLEKNIILNFDQVFKKAGLKVKNIFIHLLLVVFYPQTNRFFKSVSLIYILDMIKHLLHFSKIQN